MSIVKHPDCALARRLLAGDERAFREFFDGCFPKLYRFALVRLNGNQDDAADAVQQTFFKSFEHLHTYRGEASLYTWMCQICRHCISDLMRKRHIERRHVQLLEDSEAIRGILDTLSAAEADEPDRIAARTDIARLIQATLDCLPGHYGDVLEWKYVDGLSVREIAERLAVGPKAAESLLTRARSAFREAVETIQGSSDLLPAATRNTE